MDQKKRVLIVTNAITDDEVLEIKKALRPEYAPAAPVSLSLVHVIPRLPISYFNSPSIGILVDRYHHEAKIALARAGEELGVTKDDQWIISGKFRTEVLRLATQLNSNFILAGAQQMPELQRSLFFNNIHYAMLKNINQFKLA